MRRSQRLIAAAVLIALSGALAGCSGSLSNWDPTDMLDFLDTKKKMPGERKPVFPEGVPGLEQGVPRELYKGAAQQQIDQQNAQAAAAAAAHCRRGPKSKQAAKSKNKPPPRPPKGSRPPRPILTQPPRRTVPPPRRRLRSRRRSSASAPPRRRPISRQTRNPPLNRDSRPSRRNDPLRHSRAPLPGSTLPALTSASRLVDTPVTPSIFRQG